MRNLKYTGCCAVKELGRIGGKHPEDVMLDLYYDLQDTKAAFITFTSNHGAAHGYGDVFKQYIIDNDIGTVVETGAKYNPNSKRYVRVFVWSLHRQKLSIHVESVYQKKMAIVNNELRNFGLAVNDRVVSKGSYDQVFYGEARILAVVPDYIILDTHFSSEWYFSVYNIEHLSKVKE